MLDNIQDQARFCTHEMLAIYMYSNEKRTLTALVALVTYLIFWLYFANVHGHQLF